MAQNFAGYDSEGRIIYTDEFGNRVDPNQTVDYYGGQMPGQGSFVPPTKPVASGMAPTTTKLPVAPPAYDPTNDYQANFNDWKSKQEGRDTYTTEALRGAQLERQTAYDDWANVTGPEAAKIPGYYEQNANKRDSITAGLAAERQGYNQQDQQSLGQFDSRMSDLYASSIPNYQAAQWQSNPQDIANQNQALGNFNSIYGGSLDYQAAQAQAALAQAKMAQLHQYASDPTDVNRQKKAIEELHGMINGGEWADSMRDVRDKYKGLTDPEITAQERFIMENFRQQREDFDRSEREGVQSNLAARGLRSGAAEQTGMLTSQQELGRQNVLAQLGAESNAIGRSQQAMQGWANTSAQGREAQLAAMGMYVDAAGQLRSMNDQVGMFNTSEANTTERLNATNQTNVNMHNSAMQTNTNQFNAAQTNTARANNQATRLSGAQGFASQSNAIRQSNDAVGTFNTGQTNIVGLANMRKDQDELIRKQGVAQTQHDTGVSTRAGMDTRSTSTANDRRTDADIRTGGQIAGSGAIIGWQDANFANRQGIANSGANTALGISNVFTPTITMTGQGTNRLIEQRANRDVNKRLG